ncbi:hypothetical protein AB0910_10790 [Streptomyces sp. NPDC047002]|uniref:hypothetical protein n=1 Tax=Streptomyces sp. NPDC047002 TaxID=3155475 RepID=UPI003455EDDC
MLSRPRSLLFWIVLIILLYMVAVAPSELGHFVLSLWHGARRFFASLNVLISTLNTS